MSLNASIDDFVAKLAAELNPIRVTDDPRNVNPPCVFVGAPTNLERGPCGLSGLVPVIVIAAGPANLDARRWLLDVVEQVQPFTMSPDDWTSTTFYADPSATNGQPAYQTTTILNS